MDWKTTATLNIGSHTNLYLPETNKSINRILWLLLENSSTVYFDSWVNLPRRENLGDSYWSKRDPKRIARLASPRARAHWVTPVMGLCPYQTMQNKL